MTVEVTIMEESEFSDYSTFVHSHPQAQIYHTLEYKELLHRIVPEARAEYLLGFAHGKITAILPVFTLMGDAGSVINSLPFYGSHGGLLAENESDGAVAAVAAEFETLSTSDGVISATVIEPVFPTAPDNGSLFTHDVEDYRIGQVSFLPSGDSCEAVEARIMSGMHQKARNSLRRGLRENFVVSHGDSPENIAELEYLHCQNMTAIGGQAKPSDFFLAIPDVMSYDKHYRVYMAHAANGDVAASLLVLYFRDWVEYFVPASHQDYRSRQPLSVLILKAMTDAVLERQSTRWNWGGTWATQDGVYRFKSRWGGGEHRYRYFVRLPRGKDPLKALGREGLQQQFPFFFTCPYSMLDT